MARSGRPFRLSRALTTLLAVALPGLAAQHVLKTQYSDQAYPWPDGDNAEVFLSHLSRLRSGQADELFVRDYSDQIGRDERYHVAHLDLAGYYMGGRDHARAARHVSAAYKGGIAIGDHATAGIAVYNLAKMLFDFRDKERARDILHAALQQEEWPEGVQPLADKNAVQLLEIADGLLARSTSALPMRSSARGLLVQVLVAERQYEAARDAGRAAEQLDPGNALALNEVAISYVNEGRSGEAIPWWIKAVEAAWPSGTDLSPSLPGLASIAFNNLCTSVPVERLFPRDKSELEYQPGGPLERRLLAVMRVTERTGSTIAHAAAAGGRASLLDLPDVHATLPVVYAMLNVRKAMAVGVHWRYMPALEEAVLSIFNWCVQAYLGHAACILSGRSSDPASPEEDAQGTEEAQKCAQYKQEWDMCKQQATGQWHPYWFVHIGSPTVPWSMHSSTLLQPVNRPTRVLLPTLPPCTRDRLAGLRAKRKLRTAVCSFDFREHAFGYIVEGWLHQYDRSCVSLSLWSLSFWAHPSGHVADSVQTRKLQALCDSVGCSYHNIEQGTPSAAAALEIASIARPHIFVDAMGPTFGSRPEMVAFRPAPVLLLQNIPCSSLTDDAITTDGIIMPPESLLTAMPTGVPAVPRVLVRAFVEPRAVFMPHTWFLSSFDSDKAACKKLDRNVTHRCPAAVYATGRRRLRLGALVAVDKLDSDALSAWAGILLRHPTATLTILGAHDRHNMRRIREELAVRGVHPGRLRYRKQLGHAAHLQAVGAGLDLMLDPWVCNGHTTAAEALWAGVPLLTMEGQHLHNRVASSLLQASGLGIHAVTVARTADGYAALADELLSDDGQRLYALRNRVLRASAAGNAIRSEVQIQDVERAHRVIMDSIAIEHTVVSGSHPALHLVIGA